MKKEIIWIIGSTVFAFVLITFAVFCSNEFLGKLGWFIFHPRKIGLLTYSILFAFIVSFFRSIKQNHQNQHTLKVAALLNLVSLALLIVYQTFVRGTNKFEQWTNYAPFAALEQSGFSHASQMFTIVACNLLFSVLMTASLAYLFFKLGHQKFIENS